MDLHKGMCVDMKIRAPTSGGQYHWTFMLAPASCRKFFSYIMGMRFEAEDYSRRTVLSIFQVGLSYAAGKRS